MPRIAFITAMLAFSVSGAQNLGAQEAPTRYLFTNVQVWDGLADGLVSADVLKGRRLTCPPPSAGRTCVARLRPAIPNGGVGARSSW